LLFIIKRIQLPSVVILFIALLALFFSEGSPLVQIGFLTITDEGLFSFVLITGRFLSIMLIMIVLFTTSTFLDILKGLRALKVPVLLCDMTLFSFRYLFELKKDFQTMQTAMRMRGFKGEFWSSLTGFSSLAGSLLVRSYEQSERVYQAMTMRGYGAGTFEEGTFSAGRTDYFILLVLLSLSLLVFLLEYLI